MFSAPKTNYLQTSNRASGRIAQCVESSPLQRLKDLDRLKALNVSMPTSPSTPTLSSTENRSLGIDLNKKPSLSRENFSFSLTPTGSAKGNSTNAAKARAIALLQKKPIEKANPNFIKHRGTEAGKKRAHNAIEEASTDDMALKKRKLEEEVEKLKNDRIRQILNAKSSHSELIEAHENKVQDQYFNKLEKKEAMEEKMLNTTKMECKAVICLQCKYKGKHFNYFLMLFGFFNINCLTIF